MDIAVTKDIMIMLQIGPEMASKFLLPPKTIFLQNNKSLTCSLVIYFIADSEFLFFLLSD